VTLARLTAMDAGIAHPIAVLLKSCNKIIPTLGK